MSKIAQITLVFVVLLWGYTSQPLAQTYPEHPITMVLPMAPGDASDVVGRAMGDELSKLLKVPIVPLNKVGAAGTVGTNFVVQSKKDGYTILFTVNASVVSAKALTPESVPYDPFKDLIPLGLAAQNPMIITVRSDAPYKNFKEMIEFARRNPGKIRCSMMGVRSIGHINLEIVNGVTGMNIEIIPFKGATPAVTALLGGHVEATIVTFATLSPQLRSGALKAVLTSVKVSEFPDVPTLKDLAYPQDLLGVWFAFFGPTGIPGQVKATLESSIEKVVRDPAIASKMASLGMVQSYEPGDKLLKRMKGEYGLVEEIAKRTGMIK